MAITWTRITFNSDMLFEAVILRKGYSENINCFRIKTWTSFIHTIWKFSHYWLFFRLVEIEILETNGVNIWNKIVTCQNFNLISNDTDVNFSMLLRGKILEDDQTHVAKRHLLVLTLVHLNKNHTYDWHPYYNMNYFCSSLMRILLLLTIFSFNWNLSFRN